MTTYTYSKQVTRVLVATTKAARSVREMAEPVAAAISDKLKPFVREGEAATDWALLQSHFERLLEATAEGLREIDVRHIEKELGSHLLRDQRDTAANLLRQELRTARLMLDRKLSKEDAYQFFPQRSSLTGTDAPNLVRLGQHIAALLRGDAVKQRVRSAPGDPLDADTIAQAVEAATAQLEAVLVQLEPMLVQEARSAARRRQERAEALKTWRRTRDVLSSFYRMAGFDEQADRLQERRRKAAEEEETGQGENSGETGAGTTPPSTSTGVAMV